MRILYLTDRLSLRGGADQHLLQVITAAVTSGASVTVAYGRLEVAALPAGVQEVHRVKGLAAAVGTGAGLGQLDGLLGRCDLVHVQNVMNPRVLALAAASGRTLVTVQDHRVFCPGPGKTLPDGSPCTLPMDEELCGRCLPDPEYRQRTVDLTRARRNALQGCRLLVLSRYMAEELTAAGLPGAEVLPPWIEIGVEPVAVGTGFVLAGRLVPHKGVLDAWQAWRIAGTGQELQVAGSGPLQGRLQGARLHGWLTADQLCGLLARSRALLFPCRWQEPFGIVGVEALAAGTPVIVAEVGGTGEWSEAGCLIVPAGDASAMAAAMGQLARNPELACRLGRQGRRLVARRFSRPVIEARLLSIYRELGCG